jgi:tetratricopeptide (TPR) repeat protein
MACSLPKNAQAHYFMGKAQFSLNNKSEAEKHLNSALKIDSNHAESLMLLSNIYVNRFEYDKAISILEKAYAISKNNSIPKNII